MRTLVVYYSRSGNTRKAAAKLRDALSCDILEIDDGVKRNGIIGYFRCAVHAIKKKAFPLEPMDKDPSGYDMVVLCTPIWAGTMSTPIRSFVSRFKHQIKRHSIVCAQGSVKEQKIFAPMKEIMGREADARIWISDRWWKDGSADGRITEFASEIKAGISS
ncbi:MAG: hypothetical protein KAH57_07430 [Thermoplasmata archaeon]|nr:hypothetical protein [Thermoplasmata archaeon]